MESPREPRRNPQKIMEISHRFPAEKIMAESTNDHDSGTDSLEVPTIYKAYVREYHHKTWPEIWYTTSIESDPVDLPLIQQHHKLGCTSKYEQTVTWPSQIKMGQGLLKLA